MIDFSIVVPAYNEEAYIAKTLVALRQSIQLVPKNEASAEIVVVDHSSTDNTAREANLADTILNLPRGGSIGSVRNFGAKGSKGKMIVFVDADTIVPENFFATLVAFAEAGVVGGAVRGFYEPKSWLIQQYARFWDWYAARSSRPMTQGVCQYIRREEFEAIGGYDEGLWFAEDTDFYWRLHDHAQEHGKLLGIPTDVFVFPSSRRMDKWPAWKMIFWTNPYMSKFRLKSARHWQNWYGRGTVR
ncbi:glycosyltransferase involved in cell wall biosynthesis [Rhizobium leguminosarum]|uniref:Glycosyltransferase involved in cell wall biosynthesis n=1 Tax=Rhizobium leguminosarum TaxID=384 RepID=A0AAE2MLT0_RHILE|nr:MULTISPECIES: glycosyltransferase [Rhizobium]MBB4291993.1 glycosyltransferase involved in cell wall biosynthesis [Rhizobium leguminosarum]MBB4310069.1 glycosyltransferase involved in cell wall biosynthesis [Rhizobium leguminosarum]MBB4419190.1 glycosyltransferase involved in cell wall biosynthesis [Rhizobium leguminosarum]MBB4433993.1 glycosyltransferase involved in cell wall biosynthesis [Rhizobium esperanzae]MBB4531227.1 glycosyltransferase involved in cell wall biosynthesis [Rhizobium le